MVKNLPANNAEDMGLIPELGRSPGERKDNPLQYSCLKNPIDRGAWQVTDHRVTKSQTRLKQLSMHTVLFKKWESLNFGYLLKDSKWKRHSASDFALN